MVGEGAFFGMNLLFFFKIFSFFFLERGGLRHAGNCLDECGQWEFAKHIAL
jgi:hypothetical protein